MIKDFTKLGLVVFALLVSAVSCVTVEKSYPDKRYYVIEAARGAASGDGKASGVLLVSSLRV